MRAYPLQDFLICLEMLVFSMVHHWVFSYRQFAAPQFAAPHVASASAAPESVTRESSDFTRAMKAMVDLDDV